MSIVPEFIDPNYLYINLDVRVKFDPKNSRFTLSEIEALTRSTIQNYFSFELILYYK
jgi:hypothetical protein